MPLWHAFIFFCSILVASCAIYAQVPDAYSYNSIAAFANWLVEQKEYYRAYQEYKRLHIMRIGMHMIILLLLRCTVAMKENSIMKY